MNCSISALESAAKCYRCNTTGSRRRIKLYLLCQIKGMGFNLIPPGSTYNSSNPPTFTLNVNPTDTYTITWGSNELSMSLCGTVFNSTGAGTQTVVYTGACTQMVFTGNFAGTTVTAVVTQSPTKPADPTGFSLTTTASGGALVASWDTPPPTVSQTLVQTSPDGVTWSTLAFINSPTTSVSTITNPTNPNSQYVRIRWIGTNGQASNYTAPIRWYGFTSAWGSQVVTNGGTYPAPAVMKAHNTFHAANDAAGLISAALLLDVLTCSPGGDVEGRTPFYRTFSNALWTKIGLPTLSVNGWTPGAANTYFQTGFNPSTSYASINANGLGCYAYSATTTNNTSDLGNTNGTNEFSVRVSFTGVGVITHTSEPPATAEAYGTVIPFQGFIHAVRRASNDTNVYVGSSTVAFTPGATNNGAPAAYNNTQCYAMTMNNGGIPSGTNATNTYSGFWFTLGMTQTQVQAFYNAYQALRVALGGGFR